MIVTRKNLAREALEQALEVREEAAIAFDVPLCIYGLCDRLRVRVQFVDINMEGLYLASTRPLIQLSSLRSLGRRVFNYGHELGHHVFGHGSTLDELQEEHRTTSNSNPKEFLIGMWRDGRRRRGIFQAGVFDPVRDHTGAVRQPFPCLQHISLVPDAKSGTLGLNAFYATEQLFVKAYGNRLGLARLGSYLAQEMGLQFDRLTCFAGIEKMD